MQSTDIQEAADNAISGDVALLPIGYVLLVIYSTMVLGSSNAVHSYGSLALISFTACGLAIVGMWGFVMLCGVTFSLVVQASFFLLAGLAMDDTFVVMAAHGQLPSDWSPRRRVVTALSKSGVSITLTSLTNALAFASGTITTLPAIRIFALFSLVGVLFNYLLGITYFISFLFW